MQHISELLAAFVTAVEPPRSLTVSEWALEERYVGAESGSPFAGKWEDRIPYLNEIMDCCGLDDPSPEVTVMGSAQSGKSEVGVNTIGAVIQQYPSPILVVLPSLDEAKKYNNTKLQTTIDATPALRQRVRQNVSRDDAGSTTFFKRFAGGFLVVTTASSSKGLQMLSCRVRIYEEIVEYEADVDGRGSPIDQGESRAIAWTLRGGKAIYISTPGIDGACAISQRFETSDQRRLYVPCPQCGHFQVLDWDRMRITSSKPPYGTYFECVATPGCVLEEHAVRASARKARFIKTYPGDPDNPAPPPSFPPEELDRWRSRPSMGRHKGFHIWQANNPLVLWDSIWAKYEDALEKGATALKTFTQQWLGRPWKQQGAAPPAERLVERREFWPAERIPPGVLFLTAATDVQGNRLEYGIWGWDRRLTGYLIAHGVLEGDPNRDEVWQAHDALMAKSYLDAWGRSWRVDKWGIDSGYLTTRVYMYVRRHAISGKLLALDGRKGWKLPAIGTAKKVSFPVHGRKLAVMLYPVGTWDLKSEVYSKLQLTLQGADSETGLWAPGAIHLPMSCDQAYMEQLTAEYLFDQKTTQGAIVPVWMRKAHQANEALDIAVYSLGLAHHESDGMTPMQWDLLAAARLGAPGEVQADMAAMWSADAQAQAMGPRMQPVVDGRPADSGGRRTVSRPNYMKRGR